MSELIKETPTPEKSRVLITGASGFLGKYAVEEFSRHGYGVIATGRNQTALAAIESSNVTTIPASLAELSSMELPVETVIHSAALSSPWGTWREFHESNVAGTQHIVDFSEKNNIRRLVYVSSPSIYSGTQDRFNIPENDYDPNNRLNHYIRSKIMAEQLLQEALQHGRLQELTIIRPRGLMGVGDPSMIPRLITANEKIGIPLFNDGNNIVDITCVENVSYSLRLAAEAAHADGKVYNITNGEPRSFKSILDEFFGAIGETPHYRHMNLKIAYGIASALEKIYSLGSSEPPLTRYTVSTLGHSQTLDISRAKQELGYTPTMTLSEGIAKYAAHYRGDHG